MSIETKKNIFLPGFTNVLRHEETTNISALQFSLFYDALIRFCEDNFPFLTQADIRDLRGWQENGKETLLQVRGQTLSIPHSERQHPFRLEYQTLFSHFEGKRHIIHDARLEHEGIIKEIAPSAFLLRELFPVELTEVFIGMELYKAKRFGSLLGFVPSIHARYQMRLSQSQWRIEMKEEEAPERGKLSSVGDKMLSLWAKCLESSNICPDLRKSLAYPQ